MVKYHKEPMKDRIESWLQIIVPSVVTLIFSGGGLWVITEFQARLPEWFYNIVIAAIAVVFIALLFFFLILIIRAAFGEWIRKLFKLIKDWRDKRTRLNLAQNWNDTFSALAHLIREVITGNGQITSDQSDRYRRLRSWFRDTRSKFILIWFSFNQHRTVPAHEGDYDSTTELRYKVFRENDRDPFSFFYEPLALSVLIHILNRWHENEIQNVLLELIDRMEECAQWLRSR